MMAYWGPMWHIKPDTATLSELKEWLELYENKSYLGHRMADAHERLVAAVKAAIKEKEE